MKRSLYTIFATVQRARLLITGVLVLLFSESWSQTGTVLDTARTWVSYDNIDLYSSQHLPDTFNIYVSSSVVRLTYENREREFPLSNIQGSWAVISQAGAVTFDVKVLDLYGKGKLQRTGNELSLVIDLSERKDWMKRKFIISQP